MRVVDGIPGEIFETCDDAACRIVKSKHGDTIDLRPHALEISQSEAPGERFNACFISFRALTVEVPR